MKWIMKLSIVCALAISLSAQEKSPPSAKQVMDEALRSAAAQKKNVLVLFRASWCKYCKALGAMLESPEVGKLFHDSYVITHLTIQERNEKVSLENPGAQDLVNEAGGKGSGIPFLIIFDGAGKRLGTSLAMKDGSNIGQPVTPEEIEAFDRLLQKTAPRLTASQRAQIAKYLKDHEPK